MTFDYNYQNIFEKKSIGSIYSRFVNQISMIFNSFGSDGGLFVVIGKKQKIENKCNSNKRVLWILLKNF